MGMPFRVVMKKWLCGGKKDSEAHRDQNGFMPLTDNLTCIMHGRSASMA
jgi:hypothetical protein